MKTKKAVKAVASKPIAVASKPTVPSYIARLTAPKKTYQPVSTLTKEERSRQARINALQAHSTGVNDIQAPALWKFNHASSQLADLKIRFANKEFDKETFTKAQKTLTAILDQTRSDAKKQAANVSAHAKTVEKNFLARIASKNIKLTPSELAARSANIAKVIAEQAQTFAA
jgi:hypothetical protein